MTIDLTVTEEEYNIILACLQEQPYKMVIGTVLTLARQKNQQPAPQLSVVGDEEDVNQ